MTKTLPKIISISETNSMNTNITTPSMIPTPKNFLEPEAPPSSMSPISTSPNPKIKNP
jgi:hypothetical protein